MVRRVVAAPTASVAAMVMTGCGSEGDTADGPRKQICGEWIGRAEVIGRAGPWYVDASGGSAPPVVASAGASPTWVQVSADCERGTQVSVSDPDVIAVAGVIKPSDEADVAVLISPVSAGHATLTATGRLVIAFTVYAWTTPIPTHGW